MENNILAIATPKLKFVAMKWMSTKHGTELEVEGKEKHLTTFVPYAIPEKTEHANDLEEFLDKAMEEPRAMKTNIFKKRKNHATAVKRSLKTERNDSTAKEKHTEEVGVLELIKIASYLNENNEID